MTWLSSNLGVVISMVVLAAGAIAAWAVNSYRIGNLERDKELADKRADKLEEKLNEHITNTTLHIDPHRDKVIWEEFKTQMVQSFTSVTQRFDSTDRKIERIIMLLPGRSEV